MLLFLRGMRKSRAYQLNWLGWHILLSEFGKLKFRSNRNTILRSKIDSSYINKGKLLKLPLTYWSYFKITFINPLEPKKFYRYFVSNTPKLTTNLLAWWGFIKIHINVCLTPRLENPEKMPRKLVFVSKFSETFFHCKMSMIYFYIWD